MVVCVVKGCENKTTHKNQEQIERESNGFKISFYRFPHSEERRKLWIEALERENWIPDDKSVICSDHFSTECFERSDVLSYIAKHAIPTIFPTDLKPDVENFEFIPISNPNEVLRINKSTLEIDDPLNVSQMKLEPQETLTESMDIETVLVKEELTDEFNETPVINKVMFPTQSDDSKHFNVTCDTSAQTDDSVQMEEMISDSRLEDEEIEKTKIYRKKIRTLQQQIRRQDKLIQNLEDKIAEIRGRSD